MSLAVLSVFDAGAAPELRMLVQRRREPDGLALPGRFVRNRQTIAQTTEAVLRQKVGLEPARAVVPRLLRIFDDPARDSRTWAMSAAHSVSVVQADAAGARGEWLRVLPDGSLAGPPDLLFDHALIVDEAVAALRDRCAVLGRFVGVQADPDGFLGEERFTLHQLRLVHDAVSGEATHKDNFNRRVKGLVEPVLHKGKPVLSDGLRGRPAALFTRCRPRGVGVRR